MRVPKDTDRLRNTKFIIPPGPRTWRHIAQGHTDRLRVVRSRRQEQGRRLGSSLISK